MRDLLSEENEAEKKSVEVIFVVIIAICQSRILNIYAHFPFDFRVMIAIFARPLIRSDVIVMRAEDCQLL